ncbi:MAG: S8 family peptidase [bacterium]
MRNCKSLFVEGLLCLGLVVQAHASQKIVTFSPETTPQERIESVNGMGGKVVRELRIINAVAAEFPATRSDRQILAAPDVEAVEEDRYIKWIESNPETLYDIPLPSVESVIAGAQSANTDIPDFVYSKTEPAADSEIPWGVARVNAAAAWEKNQGEGVKVGVVDTGIDLTHPELAASIIGGYNSVNPSMQPMDDHGHGTHVSGTIAAIRDGKGVVGVAPMASLYAVKVLDAQGSGTYSGVIAGIEWCVNNKVDVINMSLGGSQGSPAMAKVMKAAYDAGITIVCAAGNSSGAVSYPAAYPEAIAVSASDSNDNITYFSCFGPQIAVIAPGLNIPSTWKGGGYKTISGTSMSSPHVAGLAALAIGSGAKGPDAVRKALTHAAVKLPKLTEVQQGAGMVDAGRLVNNQTVQIVMAR